MSTYLCEVMSLREHRNGRGAAALGRSREEMPDPIAFTSQPVSVSALVSPGLNLNELLIRHSAATFCFRMEGSAMEKAGVLADDILIIDRALSPQNGDLVVAIVEGEFLVRRIQLKPECLLETDASQKPIRVQDLSDFEIWGVVTYVIHSVKHHAE